MCVCVCVCVVCVCLLLLLLLLSGYCDTPGGLWTPSSRSLAPPSLEEEEPTKKRESGSDNARRWKHGRERERETESESESERLSGGEREREKERVRVVFL